MSSGTMTAQEAEERLASALEWYDANPGGLLFSSLAKSVYRPDKRLAPLLDSLRAYMKKRKPTQAERAQAGQLLEQIAFVCFDSIKGREKIKSFQSAGPQIDLYVSGKDALWLRIASYLGVSSERPGIVVECKAQKGRVTDQTFSRLCSIVEQDLCGVASMGVFFSLRGATGFPERGKNKKRGISDARLRQVLFHARTRKPVVVLDAEDILDLDEPGSLLVVLERKVEDISLLPGSPTSPPSVTLDSVLPHHLQHL